MGNKALSHSRSGYLRPGLLLNRCNHTVSTQDGLCNRWPAPCTFLPIQQTRSWELKYPDSSITFHSCSFQNTWGCSLSPCHKAGEEESSQIWGLLTEVLRKSKLLTIHNVWIYSSQLTCGLLRIHLLMQSSSLSNSTQGISFIKHLLLSFK